MQTAVALVLAFAVALVQSFEGERQQNLSSLIPLETVDTLTIEGVHSATLVEKDGTELYVRVSAFLCVMAYLP